MSLIHGLNKMRFSRISIVVSASFIFLFSAFSAFSVSANEKDIERIMEKMNTIKESPQKFAKAVLFGGDRVAFCSVCHGSTGNGKREGVPVLAGQNPKYLFIQFEKFVLGERKEEVMQTLAKNLTIQDKINIALFYSSAEVEPKSIEISENDIKAGRDIYVQQCSSCHGEDAKGHGMFPRIAGQNPEYSVKSLHSFRKTGGERDNELMRSLVNSLSDEQIRQVSFFISSMK